MGVVRVLLERPVRRARADEMDARSFDEREISCIRLAYDVGRRRVRHARTVFDEAVGFSPFGPTSFEPFANAAEPLRGTRPAGAKTAQTSDTRAFRRDHAEACGPRLVRPRKTE